MTEPSRRPKTLRPPRLSPSRPVPAQATTAPAPAPEAGGRDGPDPVRYGDWENKGIAVDF